MPVLAMAIPVPLGKTTALEQHIAEAVEHEEFEETLKGFGIMHESWHIQETPQGDLLILVFQSDDPASMLQEFAQSEKPLPVLQKQFIKEALGVDLSQPPPGPLPRTIFEWP
ncbi:uncharacterized protein METZ01_LOCUS219940 [marine metagenome]|uniref:ABM domain-containing protein n=1 Tax=marine metagenome TaxID=408172 RepID=A0A382FVF5_9ZZZZ